MVVRPPAPAPELSDEEVEELAKFREREVSPLVLAGRRPEAVRLIREKLRHEHRTAVRVDLLADLSTLLLEAGQDEEALESGLERISLAPDDPLGWSGLANLYQCSRAFAEGNRDVQQRAVDAIDTAVAKARACHAQLRYCLNDRCRLATELNRWDILEDSMRQILAMPLVVGALDIWPEGDFLKGVADNVIDPKLLEDYRRLLTDWRSQVMAAGFESPAAYWCK